MPRPGVSDGCGPLVDPPWDVHVVVMPSRREAGTQARTAVLICVRVLIAFGIATAGVAALLVSGTARGGHPSGAAPTVQSRPGGPLAVAAAFRYPLGCVGAAISGGDRGSSAEDPDRASPCWRYGVYVTAILRQARGEWRLALEAVSPSCPKISIPAPMRAQLAVCERRQGPPA